MTHNTCSSDLCESVSVVGARQVDVSMLKRLLSPRSESLEPMAASCLETTFDAVVDAQSQHYAVPALALASVTKKIQNFFKVVAVVDGQKTEPDVVRGNWLPRRDGYPCENFARRQHASVQQTLFQEKSMALRRQVLGP